MLYHAYLCPLCNLNTLWNIIMILHSYVEQVMTMCCIQEWQLLLLYFLNYFPMMVSDAILCPLHNLNTLWNIIMILHSYVEQVMTICHVQEWQLLLLYFLSYFPLMVSDAISCPLHNWNTLWNIIMVFHSYVKQVMTMCRVQKWQISLLYFLSYFPLMVSDAISCPLHYLNTLWNIIMILHSYIEQVMTMCHVQERQLSLLYFLSYFPLIVSDAILCPLHNLKTVWNVLMILYSYVEQVMKLCHIQEWQLSLSYFLSYFPLIIFRCNFVSTL